MKCFDGFEKRLPVAMTDVQSENMIDLIKVHRIGRAQEQFDHKDDSPIVFFNGVPYRAFYVSNRIDRIEVITDFIS